MRNLLAFIGTIAILVVMAAAVYLFAGFYNVAVGDRETRNIFDQALVRIRNASISRHADSTPPISLDDPQIVQAGAREFAEHNCDECHGAPGVLRKAFGRAMNPGPPGPRNMVDDDPRYIFWIIKNGIRMTAMPSFGSIGVSDNDIWEIVAFIKKFSTVSADQYKVWTAPPAQSPPTGQAQ
jgi:mono/diheme cytochrome c family protein